MPTNPVEGLEIYDVPDNMDEFGEPKEVVEDVQDDLVDIDEVGTDDEEENQTAAFDEEEPEEEEQPDLSDEEETPEEETKTQTPEENAFYAEQRRQQQDLQRQQELEQQFLQKAQETPEYKVAQLLAAQYGMPVDQMLQQLQESQLEQQAQQQGVPVEFLKQQQETQRQMQEMESKLKQMEFEAWMGKQEAEAAQIKSDYPFLTEQDINDARHFMLNDLQTTNMPLSQAVFAKHQDKITSHLKEQARQEALAEISGRKSNGVAPNVSQSSPESQLTLEEKAMAQALGISEADYLKYK
jgi:hypothetical protein